MTKLNKVGKVVVKVLSRQQKLALLNEWKGRIKAINNWNDQLGSVLGLTSYSPHHKVINGIIDSYGKSLSLLLGDDGNWLGWYYMENNMGKKGLIAKASERHTFKRINTFSKLLDIMEAK